MTHPLRTVIFLGLCTVLAFFCCVLSPAIAADRPVCSFAFTLPNKAYLRFDKMRLWACTDPSCSHPVALPPTGNRRFECNGAAVPLSEMLCSVYGIALPFAGYLEIPQIEGAPIRSNTFTSPDHRALMRVTLDDDNGLRVEEP